LHQPLATPARFQADGRKQCTAAFSELAALFGVIDQYDGDVRWRDAAPAIRDACAHAAATCKAGGDDAFAEATAKLADLEEIVRGGRFSGDNPPPPKEENWSALAERPQLMQRLQAAHRDRLRPQLADVRQFAKSSADIRHEAEMLALLSEIIRRPKYEYYDDDAFHDYAGELQTAAQDLSRAAAAQDYEAARAALARADQSCTNCHDAYRL
jgi:cytochrome c556